MEDDIYYAEGRVGIGVAAEKLTGKLDVRLPGYETPPRADASLQYWEDGFNPSASFWQSFTVTQSGRLASLTLVIHDMGGTITLAEMANLFAIPEIAIFQGEGTGGQMLWNSTDHAGEFEVLVPERIPGPLSLYRVGIAIDRQEVVVSEGEAYTWLAALPEGEFFVRGSTADRYSGGRSSLAPHIDLAFQTEVALPGLQPAFYVQDDQDNRLDPADHRVGIRTDAPTAPLDINGDRLRIRTSQPLEAADWTSCQTGDISWNSYGIFVCVSENEWRYAAFSEMSR